ncbi:MAG: hypothetical protein ACUVTX_05920, partial [Bacteroidales bacterium]
IFIALSSFYVSKGQFTRIGTGPGFTTGFPFHQQTLESNKSSKLDVFLKGVYEITLPLHVSPSFTWIFPNIYKVSEPYGEEKTSVSAIMFDFNGHYIFNSLDRFKFYGLAGLDILLARKKYVSTLENVEYKSIEKDNALGLNLGAGTYLLIAGPVDLFVEAKYMISKYDQFMVNAGVLLNLEWLTRKEEAGQ